VQEAEPEPPVTGIPPVVMTGSFSFIQESEIETPAFEEGVEWVEKADAAGHLEDQANDHAAEAPAEVGFFFMLLTIY